MLLSNTNGSFPQEFGRMFWSSSPSCTLISNWRNDITHWFRELDHKQLRFAKDVRIQTSVIQVETLWCWLLNHSSVPIGYHRQFDLLTLDISVFQPNLFQKLARTKMKMSRSHSKMYLFWCGGQKTRSGELRYFFSNLVSNILPIINGTSKSDN